MSIQISRGGIVEGATALIATKNSRRFEKNPDTIIIHYTAGTSAKSSAEWLQRTDVKASAHVVIGKEGEVYQIVPFTHIAWHAGESSFGGRKNFNDFSIGIELDNPGILSRVGDEFVAAFGTKYLANMAFQGIHRNEKTPRFWHIYTEAQIKAAEDLVQALISRYPTINQILGHEEIAPGRKQDPGPAFPLDKFRNKILHNDRQSDTDEIAPVFTKGKVIADKLNIREGPGTDFPKVASPLPLNKELTVLGERNGWCHVKLEIEGWVSKAFIAKET